MESRIYQLEKILESKLLNNTGTAIETIQLSDQIYDTGYSLEGFKMIKNYTKKILLNFTLKDLNLQELELKLKKYFAHINYISNTCNLIIKETEKIKYEKSECLIKKNILKNKIKKYFKKIFLAEENFLIFLILKNYNENIKIILSIYNFLKKCKLYKYFYEKIINQLINQLIDFNFISNLNSEEIVFAINNLLEQEAEKKNFKEDFEEIKSKIVKKYFNFKIEDFFVLSEEAFKLVISYLQKEQYNEFINDLGNLREKIIDFDFFVICIVKLNEFFCATKSSEILDLISDLIKENESFFEKVILTLKGKKGATEYTFLAIFYKFTTKKELFDTNLRTYCADLLLSKKLEEPENLIFTFQREKIGNNLIYRLEKMLEDFKNKKICSKSEIISLNSVYWPKFKNFDVNFEELEKIKKKFILEEKRKNPNYQYKFYDSLGSCEIEFNGNCISVSLLQYKIILCLKKRSKTYEELKKEIGIKGFKVQFDLLCKYKVVLENEFGFYLTDEPVYNNVLPIVYEKEDFD